MGIRFIRLGILASTTTGVAGIARGVTLGAWGLLTLALLMTAIFGLLALALAARRSRGPEAAAPAPPEKAPETPGTPAHPPASATQVAPPTPGPPTEPRTMPTEPEPVAVQPLEEPEAETATAVPRSAAPVGDDVAEAPAPEEAVVAAGSDAGGVRVVQPAGVGAAEVLDALMESCRDVGWILSAHLWLLDSTTETMRLVESVGSARPSPVPLPIATSVVGQAADGGEPRLSGSARLRHEGREAPVWRYAVPLTAGSARGAAALDIARDRPEERLLEEVAEALRPALAAALAIHVSQTETAAVRSLLEAASDILRLVESQAIVDSGLDRAMDMADAQSGSIMLVEDDGSMRIHAARGLPERVVSDAVVWKGDGIAGLVFTTGQSLLVEDTQGDGDRARRHGVRSAAAVPITDEKGLLGVLNVGNRKFHARFSASHLRTLEGLGRIIGIALRHSRDLAESQTLYLDTVKALAQALEAKDPYLQGSAERTYRLATELGKRLALDERDRRALAVAALLHDIGMAAAGDVGAVGDRPLTTVERGMLKMHPAIAADVLGQAAALADAAPIVHHHHEHYDGGGYLGVAGESIPIGARVLSVVDAYVSMTSPRAYREARSHDEAIGELQAKSGSQFDPRVVSEFVALCAAGDAAFLGAR